jgi:ssRNA-specific RNase YbeY (16S rRNA maturation enzyme)
LYTLIQSSIKENDQVQKYFRNFKESDKETHQSLRNVFTDEEEDSFIKLTTMDKHGKTEIYTISHDTINTNQKKGSSRRLTLLVESFKTSNLKMRPAPPFDPPL